MVSFAGDNGVLPDVSTAVKNGRGWTPGTWGGTDRGRLRRAGAGSGPQRAAAAFGDSKFLPDMWNRGSTAG